MPWNDLSGCLGMKTEHGRECICYDEGVSNGETLCHDCHKNAHTR